MSNQPPTHAACDCYPPHLPSRCSYSIAQLLSPQFPRPPLYTASSSISPCPYCDKHIHSPPHCLFPVPPHALQFSIIFSVVPLDTAISPSHAAAAVGARSCVQPLPLEQHQLPNPRMSRSLAFAHFLRCPRYLQQGRPPHYTPLYTAGDSTGRSFGSRTCRSCERQREEAQPAA